MQKQRNKIKLKEAGWKSKIRTKSALNFEILYFGHKLLFDKEKPQIFWFKFLKTLFYMFIQNSSSKEC